MVVWLAPSPPADAIPSTAQVLEVVVTLDHQTALSLDIAEAAEVAAVSAMIDSMRSTPGSTARAGLKEKKPKPYSRFELPRAVPLSRWPLSPGTRK